VADIARRLDDRFTLLRDPSIHGSERRRTLAAAIGWSYDLLFPDDQRGLWALSVFAGGAPLDAAEQVLAALDVPAESAADVVSRLADRSLVSVDTDQEGGLRYRLLDSISAFSRARLVESGQGAEAGAAHAAWMGGVADGCAAAIRGAGQRDCLRVVRAERANIDAALAWCSRHDPLLGLRIATGLGWTWVVLGDGVVGAARIRGALTAAGGSADARDTIHALLLSGWLEASAGDVGQAEADLGRAGDLVREVQGDRLSADLQRHEAFLRIQQGRPHDVLAEANASVECCRRLGLDWEVAAGLLLAAYGSIMLGDTVAANGVAEEALTLLTPIDDAWGLVHAHGILGMLAQAEHRFDAAAAALNEAAVESERSGFLGQAALHLTRLGRVEQQRGELDEAVAILDRAVAAARLSGDVRIAATARTTLARILRAAGDDLAALALLERNDRWYRAAGGDGALLTRGLLLSLTYRDQPEPSGAALHGVVEEARNAGDRESELVALDALARIAAERGDHPGARLLLEEADACHAEVRHRVDDADRLDAIAARAAL
jgi:tetratricopeptide (TPR) repeat protein